MTVLILGWISLLFGGFTAVSGLASVLDGDKVAAILLIMCAPFFTLFGLHLLTMGTRVKFNQPRGFVTITGGRPFPINEWVLRKRVMSRSQAATAYVVERQYEFATIGQDQGGGTQLHTVVVAGVTISAGRRGQAEELARRLRKFGERGA